MGMQARFREKIDAYHEDRPLVPLVDAHIHLVTFLQTSEGLSTLLESMKSANVTKSVVFGLPVKKKWEYCEPRQPSYYLDDDAKCYYWSATDEIVAHEFLKLSREEQQLVAPSLCGFNPTDVACIDYLEYMFEKYPFFKGVGEILCRHDDLTSLTLEETARANHPALEKVYQFCANKGLPVVLHQNSTSVGIHNEYKYLHELRQVLDRHPETNIVWAHCGGSRRVTHPDYSRMVSRLLREYPRLHLDLSWVVYDDTVCKPRRHNQERLAPESGWLEEVILPFSERIMLGSDLCGHFDQLGRNLARYNGLLEVLPDEVRNRVARLNAEKIWFGSEI
jgi:predicted TIM-barrel fold metal-dependent hydrolase